MWKSIKEKKYQYKLVISVRICLRFALDPMKTSKPSRYEILFHPSLITTSHSSFLFYTLHPAPTCWSERVSTVEVLKQICQIFFLPTSFTCYLDKLKNPSRNERKLKKSALFRALKKTPLSLHHLININFWSRFHKRISTSSTVTYVLPVDFPISAKGSVTPCYLFRKCL